MSESSPFCPILRPQPYGSSQIFLTICSTGGNSKWSVAEQMCLRKEKGPVHRTNINGEDTNLVRLTGLEKQPSIFPLKDSSCLAHPPLIPDCSFSQQFGF